jgi:hypothetical protein
MDDQKKIIKDDINFLEYPNWVVDRKNKATIWTIQKEHGTYQVMSPLGLPKHFDKIVVYFLLYKLYREKNLETYSITTNRYEIAKNIFGGHHFGKNIYTRIMNALKKWQSISINFEGVFYEDDGYTIRGFSIIDEYILRKETGELFVRFSEAYVNQLKESKFYKLIDFDQYKKLHKTSSARLYEILAKQFKDRNEWAIGIKTLAEKITFEKREGAKDYYPSDILRYIKPSINELNKKTDLYIEFQYNKETQVCVFKKVSKPKELYVPAVKEKKPKKTEAENQVATCMVYFNSLTSDEQKEIHDGIKRSPFLQFIPNEDARIYAYMTSVNLWQSS